MEGGNANSAGAPPGLNTTLHPETAEVPPPSTVPPCPRSAGSNPDSKIKAVVANIPVPDGGAAVKAFLDGLRSADGALPTGLKGGRVVLLGAPMPPVSEVAPPL